MTLFKRRFLALLFFVIFFLSIPPLILVTSGVFYNITKKSFEKTGLLVVSSIPEGATVNFNNEPPKRGIDMFIPWETGEIILTPERVTYLFPGVYTLKIEKENFLPFERTIEIQSGKTTFVEDILLLPSAPPVQIVEASFLALSPDGTTFVTIDTTGTLFIIDSETDITLYSATGIKIPEKIHFLEDTHVLLRYMKGSILIDITSQNQIALASLNADSEFHIDSKNPDIFYWENNNSLNSYRTKIIEAPLSTLRSDFSSTSFHVYDNEVWWIFNSNLIKGSEKINKPSNLILNKVVGFSKNFVFVKTAKSTLYALHTGSLVWFPIEGDSGNDVNELLHEEGSTIYFRGDFAIGSIDTNTLESSLINRFGEQTVSFDTISLLQDKKIYIITTDSSVKILDVFSSEQILSDIYNADSVISTAYNEKDKTLLIVSREDEKSLLLEYRINTE